jgi:hypothetical protein
MEEEEEEEERGVQSNCSRTPKCLDQSIQGLQYCFMGQELVTEFS